MHGVERLGDVEPTNLGAQRRRGRPNLDPAHVLIPSLVDNDPNHRPAHPIRHLPDAQRPPSGYASTGTKGAGLPIAPAPAMTRQARCKTRERATCGGIHSLAAAGSTVSYPRFRITTLDRGGRAA